MHVLVVVIAGERFLFFKKSLLAKVAILGHLQAISPVTSLSLLLM